MVERLWLWLLAVTVDVANTVQHLRFTALHQPSAGDSRSGRMSSCCLRAPSCFPFRGRQAAAALTLFPLYIPRRNSDQHERPMQDEAACSTCYRVATSSCFATKAPPLTPPPPSPPAADQWSRPLTRASLYPMISGSVHAGGGAWSV